MTPRPRRVLALATLYPNDATPRFGTFVARQFEALAARGDWQVTLVNPIGLPPILFGRYRALAQARCDQTEGGVTVYRPRFWLLPGLGGPINPWLIARAVLPLARRLHAETPFDVVDAQFFYPDGPAAAAVARALDLPLSIKARGADIHHWGTKTLARRQMLCAGRQAAGMLAVSQALRGDMAALGLAEDRIAVHYTGLDRDRFRPLDHVGLRDKLGASLGLDLPRGAPLLVSVGALIARKGQEFVIRALPDLPAAQLLLVGTGPDEARLRQIAEGCDVGPRVHILGSIDHDLLPVVLSAADAMVLPSASEGLANAWVEALACGTPIVIGDVGGARELVDDGSAGRLVPRDPGAIAAAVRALLDARTPPAAIADRAARFSWDANAAALAAHYDRLVDTGP